jgi:hypothetical protein
MVRALQALVGACEKGKFSYCVLLGTGVGVVVSLGGGIGIRVFLFSSSILWRLLIWRCSLLAFSFMMASSLVSLVMLTGMVTCVGWRVQVSWGGHRNFSMAFPYLLAHVCDTMPIKMSTEMPIEMTTEMPTEMSIVKVNHWTNQEIYSMNLADNSKVKNHRVNNKSQNSRTHTLK